MHNQTDEKKIVADAMNDSDPYTDDENSNVLMSEMQQRDVEEAYRRGFNQGASQAAHAVKAGATATELKAWLVAIRRWRRAGNRVRRWNINMTQPPLTKVGGTKR